MFWHGTCSTSSIYFIQTYLHAVLSILFNGSGRFWLCPPVISGYATLTNGMTLFTLEDIVQYTDENGLYFDISLCILREEHEVVAEILRNYVITLVGCVLDMDTCLALILTILILSKNKMCRVKLVLFLCFPLPLSARCMAAFFGKPLLDGTS